MPDDPLVFVVAGRPVPQGSLTIGRRRNGEPYVRHGDANRVRAWRREIRAVVGKRRPFESPVDVDLTFFYKRPEAHYLKAGLRPDAPAFPVNASTADVDKLARAVLDALTGRLIVDDAVVVGLTARKLYAEPGIGARLVIKIRRAVGPVLSLPGIGSGVTAVTATADRR